MNIIQYSVYYYTINIIANTNILMTWNPDNKNYRFECCTYIPEVYYKPEPI